MLKLTVYEDKYEKEWDDFVENSSNGTIFHKRRFLNYHPVGRFQDASLLLRDKNDELISVFPAAIYDKSLISHPGASFGGPVVNQAGIEKMLQIVDRIDLYAQKICMNEVRMTLTPNLLHNVPTEGLEYAMWFKGYSYLYTELSICVHTKSWKTSPFSERRQRGINTALKNNVVIKKSKNFKTFWKILTTNLRLRHSVAPTHTLAEIEVLRKLFPKDILLFGAFHENKMIAGVVVFINNNRSFETFYIAQDYRYKKIRALDLLLSQVKDWGCVNDFDIMNLGISSEQHGEKINFGLAKFKEEFDGWDFVRRTYKKEIS